VISQIFISQTCNFDPSSTSEGYLSLHSVVNDSFQLQTIQFLINYTSPFSAVISTFLLVTPILGCTFRLLRWRTVWSAREPSRPSRMVRISCQTSTSWSANLALVGCFFFSKHQSVSYSVNAGFTNTSSFLRLGVPFPPSHSNSN